MIRFNYNQITPAILLGSAPSTEKEVALLAEQGVGAVLNLQTDADLSYHEISWADLAASYEAHGIRALRHPVTDFDPDALREHLPGCVADLTDLLAQADVAFVHCNVGMNRSPTTVIAYLHRQAGMELGAATHFVRTRRQCEPWVSLIAGADWSAVNRGGTSPTCSDPSL